jgi:hypothetical protein
VVQLELLSGRLSGERGYMQGRALADEQTSECSIDQCPGVRGGQPVTGQLRERRTIGPGRIEVERSDLEIANDATCVRLSVCLQLPVTIRSRCLHGPG